MPLVNGPAPPPTLPVWRHSQNGATPSEWRLNGGMAPNWRIGLTAGLAAELSTAVAQVACVSFHKWRLGEEEFDFERVVIIDYLQVRDRFDFIYI
eukprot:COSAG02_NODE_2342_length_9101_cov_78.830038_7_plen_95_part_00